MVYANYVVALIDLAVVGIITVIIFAAAVKLFKWREVDQFTTITVSKTSKPHRQELLLLQPSHDFHLS
jgi:hypothetical protein